MAQTDLAVHRADRGRAGRRRRPAGRRPPRRGHAPRSSSATGTCSTATPPAPSPRAGAAPSSSPGPTGCATAAGAGAGGSSSSTVASPRAPNALHGLVAWQPWTVLDRAPDRTSVGGTILEPHRGLSVPPGGRHRLRARDRTGSRSRCGCATSVRSPRPFGVGMHPYLHVGANEDGGIGGAELTVPARTALETEGGLPTGGTHRFHGDVGRIGSPRLRHPAHRSGARRRRLGPAAAARPARRARARRRRGLALAADLQRRRAAGGPAAAEPRRRADDLPAERARRRRPTSSSSSPARSGPAAGRSAWTAVADMRVLELWRYPVKSLQGERLDRGRDRRRRASPATAAGRCSTGTPASASPPAGCPTCSSARPRLRADGGVEVVLPDGTVDRGRRRPLRLAGPAGRAAAGQATAPAPPRTRARTTTSCPMPTALARVGGRPAGRSTTSPRTGVSLVSTGTLGTWDRRRFRANVVLDGPGEDGLIGHAGRARASAVLDVGDPIARCVMVTRPQPGGIGRDTSVLKTIHRERGGDLAVGAAGAHARDRADRRRARAGLTGDWSACAPSRLRPGEDTIRLGQLLKLVDAVPSGAQVKDVLSSGDVRVNGEPEDRRGRQLHCGRRRLGRRDGRRPDRLAAHRRFHVEPRARRAGLTRLRPAAVTAAACPIRVRAGPRRPATSPTSRPSAPSSTSRRSSRPTSCAEAGAGSRRAAAARAGRDRRAAGDPRPAWAAATSTRPSTWPRGATGYRVTYAIADVGAFVPLGSALDARGPPPRPDAVQPRPADAAAPAGAQRGRGQPAARRSCAPAAVWTIDLDADGEPVDGRPPPGPRAQPRPAGLRRRCRRRPTPARCPRRSRCCPRIGTLLQARAAERGAIELGTPEQEVVADRRRRLDAGAARRPAGRGAGTRRSRC